MFLSQLPGAVGLWSHRAGRLFVQTHLVQVVVGLSFLQAKGLPQLGGEPGQQFIENMIISLIFGLQGSMVDTEKSDPLSCLSRLRCAHKNMSTHRDLKADWHLWGETPGHLGMMECWPCFGKIVIIPPTFLLCTLALHT